ncbi:hypothetical protein ACX80O_15710 [Arthrobacter sp. Hz1]
MSDPVRRLPDLESTRSHLVRTVLSILEASVSARSIGDPTAHPPADAQRLLSAAIRDLIDVDDQLDNARNPFCGSKNEHTVRYALGRSDSPMTVSTYTYESLPPAERNALPGAEELSAAFDQIDPPTGTNG